VTVAQRGRLAPGRLRSSAARRAARARTAADSAGARCLRCDFRVNRLPVAAQARETFDVKMPQRTETTLFLCPAVWPGEGHGLRPAGRGGPGPAGNCTLDVSSLLWRRSALSYRSVTRRPCGVTMLFNRFLSRDNCIFRVTGVPSHWKESSRGDVSLGQH
jgi:hypothetical protein